MRIIKTNVETYLKMLRCTEQEIERFAPTITDEYELRDTLNFINLEYLWDYHPYDLEELIEKEEQWRKESQCETFEDTYVYLFGRLWEVEQ